MKYLMIIVLFLVTLVGFGQKPKKTFSGNNPSIFIPFTDEQYVDTVNKKVTFTCDGDQLAILSILVGNGVQSPSLTNSNQVSTAQYNTISKFADSTLKSWQSVYKQWHPDPIKKDSIDDKKSKAIPKTDSSKGS